MYKQILCPIDGSATSHCGMQEAIQLAKDQHAKLRLLHVVDKYFPILDYSADFNLIYIDDILQKNGKKVLKSAEVTAQAAGIEVETKMLETIGGSVAKLIVNEVKEWPADLIVMGTHGLRGVGRLVLGSDAENVVRTSPVPVLLVRNLQDSERDA